MSASAAEQALVCIHEAWESIDFLFFYGDAVAEDFREAFVFLINMQAGLWLVIVEFKTETIYTDH